MWETLQPLRWLLVVLALFQSWQLSAELTLAVLAFCDHDFARCVDHLQHANQSHDPSLCKGLFWLKPLGVSPKKVAWMLALTLRFVPLWIKINQELREAQQARGLKPSVKKQFTAMIMKIYHMADETRRCGCQTSSPFKGYASMTTKDCVLIALFAALTAALGMMPPVPMPFGVPITLQSMAPMLAGTLLGARTGALAQVLFLTLVFAGLPLLSGGRGGLGILFGPTAGFALSWVLIAALIGFLVHKPQRQPAWLPIALTCFAVAVALGAALGVTWLSVYLKISWLEAGASCLIFLPGECIKSCFTAQVAVHVHKTLPPSSLNQPAKKLL